MMRAVLLMLALLVAAPASAKVEVMQFETPEQEATYNKMIGELRCLVCQNQNLAASNSELAVDMRRKTHEMVLQNKSDKEIADFMVERYGDFVMYRPPLNSNTLLLWAGPFLILLVGVTLLIRTVLSRRAVVAHDIDDARLKAAATLLDDSPDKRDV